MNLHRAVSGVFAAKVIRVFLVFSGTVIFARRLGPSGLGAYFLFEVLLGLGSIIADFGLRGAVEKRLSETDVSGDILTSAIFLKIPPLLLVMAIVFAARGALRGYVGNDIAFLLIVALVLNEIGELTIFSLRGQKAVAKTAFVLVPRDVIWFAVSLILVLRGFGFLGLIYGLILGLAVMSLTGLILLSAAIEVPTQETMASLLHYARYNFVSHVGGYAYNWLDVAIIGLFLSQASVGTYEVAWRVSSLILLFSGAIGAALLPQFSEWSSLNDVDRIEHVLSRALTASLGIAIPAFFGVLLLSDEILKYLFSPEFTIASGVIIVLMIEKSFQMVHAVIGRALQGLDRPDLSARATVITICLNGVLNTGLVIYGGILGAAIGTTLSFGFNTFLHARYLQKFMDIRIEYRLLSWWVTSSLIMFGVLWIVTTLYPVTSLARLIILVVGGGTIYGVIVLLKKTVRDRAISASRGLISE